MRSNKLALIVPLIIAGCASDRVIEQSNDFYPRLSNLGEREVVENISATIDNPNRIPTRTTFGKGTLTFSDNLQGQLSLPLHLYGKTPGSAGANFGTYTDTFAVSINPEINAQYLAALRDLYRALVFPKNYNSEIPIPEGGVWLYWKNNDGSASVREPPAGAIAVGSGASHQIFTTDADSYYKFVLTTYGYTPSKESRLTIDKAALKPRRSAAPLIRRPVVGDRPAPTLTPPISSRPSTGSSAQESAAGTKPSGGRPAPNTVAPIDVPSTSPILGGRPNTLQETIGPREVPTDPTNPPPNIR